ncbi:MAG: hypothetical protein CML19_09875 [Pusillimonas sp.]|nr:hypothetical protein [Pusillimonas sp.]
MNIEEILEALLDDSKESYNHYGLPVYKIGGAEYAIARDDEEAEEACKECIKQSVWAFNANFLASHISALETEDIERLRGDTCESCNNALLKLIDDFDAFAEDAISSDGMGNFLAQYDSNVIEQGEFRLFRIN